MPVRHYVLAALLFSASAGCATYAPAPLDSASIDRSSSAGEKSEAGRSIDIDMSQPLSADDLAVIAVLTNPDLMAMRARQGVGEAQIFAAGLRPDPTFSFGADAVLSGGAGLVTALASSLAVDLAPSGQRQAKVRVAQADLASLRKDIAWAEWLAGEQARLLAVRIIHLDDLVAMATELQKITEAELGHVSHAVSTGDLSASELEARRLADADATSRLLTFQQQRLAAKQDLNRVLGIEPGAAVAIAASDPLVPDNLDASQLFERAVEERTDLQALRSAYESQEAKLHAAVLGQYPAPNLAVNAARDTGNVKTLGPAVSFTLPLWNRNRGAIAVETATRDQLRAEYEARLQTVRADIASALGALQLLKRQHDELKRELAPLKPQAEAAARAAARGDISASAAAATHLAVLDKNIALGDLNRTYAEQIIALEITIGQPLTTGKTN